MNEFGISKDVIDEYFQKKQELQELEDYVSEMSQRIKYEMQKCNRKIITIHGYKIRLETKFQPNFKFFELIYKNQLNHLLNPSISSSNLKKSLRKLKITNKEYEEKYQEEKLTKWLYVNKSDD